MTVGLTTNRVSEASLTGAVKLVVRLDQPRTNSLAIQVVVSDPEEIAPIDAIAVAAGQIETEISLETVNDGKIDGDKPVKLTVTAPGFEDSVVSLIVGDDDTREHRTLGGHLFGELEGYEYLVLRDITVDELKTFHIQQGAILSFKSGSGINVFGSLTATNTGSNRIRFRSDTTPAGKGSWRGISITNSSTSEILLSGVHVTDAVFGLVYRQGAREGTMKVSNSKFANCLLDGINIIAHRAFNPGLVGDAVRLETCEVSQNARHGIFLYNEAYPCGGTHQAAQIVSSRIHDNAEAGILMYVNFATGCNGGSSYRGFMDGLISANIIENNKYGILGESESARNNKGVIGAIRGAFSMKIENNLIVHNREGGIILEGINLNATRAIELRAQIANNTISRNGGFGLRFPTNSLPGFAVQNNIVTLNQSGIAQSEPGESTNLVVRHNLSYANTLGDWVNLAMGIGVLSEGSKVDAYNNLSQDPEFQVAGIDFHLKWSSPAIDAGIASGDVLIDGEGTARGKNPDIGWDEADPSVEMRSSGPEAFELTVHASPGSLVKIDQSPDLLHWHEVYEIKSESRIENVHVDSESLEGSVFFRARVN